MRLSPAERRAQIVFVAIAIAERDGLVAVSARRVAAEAPSCGFSNIRRHFPTGTALRTAVATDPRASAIIRQEARILGLLPNTFNDSLPTPRKQE